MKKRENTEIAKEKFDEYLINNYLAFKDLEKIDAATLKIDDLLASIEQVNRILGLANQHRQKLLALDTLKVLIDAVLKFFSRDMFAAIKPSERLMLIAMLIKRNCFPIYSLPARQPLLNLDLLHLEKVQSDESPKKERIAQRHKDKLFSQPTIRAIKATDNELTDKINCTKEKLLKTLRKGIAVKNLSNLSVSEAQCISLLVNSPHYELFVKDGIMFIRDYNKDSEADISDAEAHSVSFVFRPKE